MKSLVQREEGKHFERLRRTDARYRRRCATCRRFLARSIKGGYCRQCNGARRRRARVAKAQAIALKQEFERAYGHLGSNMLEVAVALMRPYST